MLKVFRENIKYLSWILWAVILVFVLFVFVDFGRVVPGQGGDRAAATVGRQSITYNEYERAYRNLEARLRQMYGDQLTPEVIKQLGIERQALEQLIGQKVLAAEARRLGLATTDAELQKTILGIPAFKDSQGRFVGPQVYEQVVRSIRYPSVEDFEDELSEQLLVDKLNQVLSANLYLSDAAVETAYRKDVEKAAIRYVQLPAQDPRLAVEVSPADLKAYLEGHRDQFRLPEQRKVAAVTVDNAALRSQVQVADADVEGYYHGHPDEFTQEEEVRARHILLQVNDQRTAEAAKSEIETIKQRIAGGEDFGAVAKEVSQDPGSAARGGDLGYFGRGRMTPEFETAAFDARTGDLVGPVVTPFGVHLLQVLDHRQKGLQPLDEAVKVRIRVKLQNERLQQAAEAKANELAKQLKEGGTPTADRLRAAAEADPVVSFQQLPPFGRDDLVPGVGRGGDFAATAFQLAAGSLSAPVKVPRGYAVLLVEEVLPPRDPQLAEVEARVRQAVEHDQRQQAAMDRLAAARADIREGKKTLDQVAAELGQTVEESGEFGRGGTVGSLGFSPRIADTAMELSTGEIGGPLGSARGAVLFEVTERKSWDPAKFKAESEQTRDRLEREELNRLLGALIQQRRAELGVTYDRPLAEQLQKDQKAGTGPAQS
jgi:peptidyl-prolyl cis-trans isomerase D